MDRRRPGQSAWSRPWLASLAVALVAACQQGFPLPSAPSDPVAPGWRVVERLGEARYLAPSMAGWDHVVPGSLIPAGSQITTGIGGRLIVQQAGDQLSAGTSSRFILPGLEPGGTLRQTAGWLRYRIAGAGGFGIETPFLDLVVGDAVLDVTVGESMTEVAVVSGRVRLSTQDGHRQIDLDAGHTGYASLQGAPLAVRRGPDRLLERVPPTVIPALHPDRTADRAAARAANGVADGAAHGAPDAVTPRTVPPRAIPAPMPKPAPAVIGPDLDALGAPSVPAVPPEAAVPTEPAVPPEAAVLPEPSVPMPVERAAMPAADPSSARAGGALLGFVAAAAPAAAVDQASADPAARPFDQLTEGLLDGLMPAQPPGARLDGR